MSPRRELACEAEQTHHDLHQTLDRIRTFFHVTQNVLGHFIAIIAHHHRTILHDALQHLAAQSTSRTDFQNGAVFECSGMGQNPLQQGKACFPGLKCSTIGRTLQPNLNELVRVGKRVIPKVVFSFLLTTCKKIIKYQKRTVSSAHEHIPLQTSLQCTTVKTAGFAYCVLLHEFVEITTNELPLVVKNTTILDDQRMVYHLQS